jgi:putative phage-type endonuclease
MKNWNIIEELYEDEIMELTVTVYELVDEHIQYYILEMHDPLFKDKFCHDICEFFLDQWCDAELYEDNEDNFHYLYKFILSIIDDYFDLTYHWRRIPLRSRQHFVEEINKKEISQKISNIRSIPQPEQRTSEWYKFRHNLITASNLGKIFGTESSLNSLIYEKCCPLKEEQDSSYVNTQSPLHWGQKYEPVSVMLYEKLYNTKVEDFGCIQHKDYTFIGASPDGINVDSNSDRYGRMLEIKNIVNREIDGIPSKNYWIQMQVQMETCELEKCDFLETRFKEYEENEFYDDEHNEKGVILYFVEKISIGESNDSQSGYPLAQQYSGKPHYEYMPLHLSKAKEDVEKWIEETRAKLRRSWSLYSTLYYYLDELSCVLVERNRVWFEAAIVEIQKTWETIEKERESGYEHRAAKKRIKSPLEVVQSTENSDNKIIKNLPISGGICLVKLDRDDINPEN